MKTPMPLYAALVAVAIAVPCSAQEISYARRLPNGNMRELAKLELPERPRRIPAHRFLPPVGLFMTPHRSVLPAVPDALTVPPPPVTLGFTSGTSRQVWPADASGAVGPSHVVGAYNNGVIVHSRSGEILTAVTQRQFWSFSTQLGDQYDPRIAYDATRDRWVMIAVDREEALLFAVSETGDPTGTWRRYDANLNVSFVDFSRIAVTRDTVMFMTVSDSFGTQSIVLSIRKDDLYSGVEPVPMKTYPHQDSGIVPVHGESSIPEYAVSLFSFSGINVMKLGSSKVDFVPAPSWLSQPESYLPQLAASNRLDIGYPQIENAVYRNGSIYAVMTADGGAGRASGVAWCRFNPETLESEWGLFSDPAGEAYYAYPSIAVNDRGEMLIGLGTFSVRQYPTAAYVFRDLLGRMSLPGLIRTGDSPFFRDQRWGDYTATVADPVEPGVFWTVQITTNQEAWGTVWGRIEQPASDRRRSARH